MATIFERKPPYVGFGKSPLKEVLWVLGVHGISHIIDGSVVWVPDDVSLVSSNISGTS